MEKGQSHIHECEQAKRLLIGIGRRGVVPMRVSEPNVLPWAPFPLLPVPIPPTALMTTMRGPPRTWLSPRECYGVVINND